MRTSQHSTSSQRTRSVIVSGFAVSVSGFAVSVSDLLVKRRGEKRRKQ